MSTTMPTYVVVTSPLAGKEGDTTGCIVSESVADEVAPAQASSSSSSPSPPSSLLPNTAAEQLLESKPAPTVDENEVCDNVVCSLRFFPSFSEF